MATGSLPFQGQSSGAIFDAILHKSPIPVIRFNPGIPHEFEQLVAKTLEKDRDLRCQTASELRADLKRLKRDTGSGKSSPAVSSSPMPSPLSATATALPSSSAPVVVPHPRKIPGFAVAAATSLLLIGGAALTYFKPWRPSPHSIDLRGMKVQRLTEHGRAVGAPGNVAISPDGRWVAYVKRDQGRSLRVKQIVTESEIEVVHTKPGIFFYGLTFTPDGNFLYYNQNDPSSPGNINTYAVPSLGGTSRLILKDVAGTVSFSPDGKQITYARNLSQGGDQLLITNADGSGERVVSSGKNLARDSLALLNASPKWSSSQDFIYVDIARITPDHAYPDALLTVRPDGRLLKESQLPVGLGLDSFAPWPDSSGMFFVGTQGFRRQLWFLSFASGEPFRITNDLDEYATVSLSGDGGSLVTTQSRREFAIYTADSPATLTDRVNWQLRQTSTDRVSGVALSWTHDGKLLQSDFAGRSYISAPDGTSRTPLLEGGDIVNDLRACGPANSVIISKWVANTLALWRFDVASKEQKRLTSEASAWGFDCTPDGQSLVYGGFDPETGSWHLFELQLDGGGRRELDRGTISYPRVSPDGNSIAYLKVQQQGSTPRAYFVVRKLNDNHAQAIEIPGTFGDYQPRMDARWSFPYLHQ
jgi:Tol biopolymer transport system component